MHYSLKDHFAAYNSLYLTRNICYPDSNDVWALCKGVFTSKPFQPSTQTQTDDLAFFAHMWTLQPHPDTF